MVDPGDKKKSKVVLLQGRKVQEKRFFIYKKAKFDPIYYV